jgi:hypothetical protein
MKTKQNVQPVFAKDVSVVRVPHFSRPSREAGKLPNR